MNHGLGLLMVLAGSGLLAEGPRVDAPASREVGVLLLLFGSGLCLLGEGDDHS